MKRWTPLIVVALLLSACGGGDENGRAQTITSPATATSQTATDRASAVGTPAQSAQTSASTPAPTPVRGALEVRKALLTLEDMPTGWSVKESKPSESTGEICGKKVFEVVSTAKADIDFEKDAFTTVTQAIRAYDSGEAKQGLDNALKVFETCKEWTDTAKDGSVTTYKLTPLSFPKLGDQTVALRLNLSNPPVVAQVDAVYVRRGDVVIIVGYTAGGLGVARGDPEALERIARKADERLAAFIAAR